MKKLLFLSIALLFCSLHAVMAQFDEKPYNGIPSNVTVFAKEGDKFWLILNGEKQNEKPAFNVKINGLTAPNYKVKVIFEDSKIPSVDANMMARDLDNNAVNVVYEVRKKAGKSNAMVMRVASYEPITSQTVTTTTQTNSQPASHVSKPAPASNSTSSSSTTTTTTDQIDLTGMPQISMSVKVPGMEGGTGSVSVSGGGVEQNVGFNTSNSSVSSSVTTTNTTRTNNNGVVKETYNSSTNLNAPAQPANTGPSRTTASKPSTQPAAEVAKPAGCRMPMSATAFNTQLSAIKKQSFSDTKKKTAKTAISKNCLSTAQVKTILKDFSFEADKVELAKFAYPYTVDKENYLSVSELFNFSSSTDELTEFLDAQ